MLKGVLEGCALEIISRGETYGYEIASVPPHTRIRGRRGRSTPSSSDSRRTLSSTSKKAVHHGPARKFHPLNEAGHAELTNFWTKWDFVAVTMNVFALLGSNGAGKTTVVNILATLLKPDGGSASVCGLDAGSQPERIREKISLTGQFAAVDGILTGRENLVLVARLRAVANPAQVADSLLQQFGLSDAANKRVDTYSGGMARKLDIAMSLIGTPEVIFLDEPTTGLDPEGRLEVWKTIKKLAGGGTTILLTTQYLDEAEHLADRIAILHGGESSPTAPSTNSNRLLPPAKVEYVEKQPTLEEIFLAVVGKKKDEAETMKTAQNTVILFGRSMRHIQRSPDTIITVAIMPIMLMLLFVYVFGGAINTGTDNYVNYLLPGILLIAIAQRHLLHRRTDLHRHAERDRRPIPLHARGTLIGAVGARADLAGLQRDQPVGTDIWVALAWCAGIAIVAYLFAMTAYKRTP